MVRVSFAHEVLLLDASSIISLYASGKMREIIEALPIKVALVTEVHHGEVLYFRRKSKAKEFLSWEKAPIDLQPLIGEGLLTEVDLLGEDYGVVLSFIDHPFNLGNGESLTAAVALRCNWSICVDDKRAIKRFRKAIPQIQLVSTLQIFQHWIEEAQVAKEEVWLVLQKIWGRDEPLQKDPFFLWWQTYF